jgi:hypothetical protein
MERSSGTGVPRTTHSGYSPPGITTLRHLWSLSLMCINSSRFCANTTLKPWWSVPPPKFVSRHESRFIAPLTSCFGARATWIHVRIRPIPLISIRTPEKKRRNNAHAVCQVFPLIAFFSQVPVGTGTMESARAVPLIPALASERISSSSCPLKACVSRLCISWVTLPQSSNPPSIFYAPILAPVAMDDYTPYPSHIVDEGHDSVSTSSAIDMWLQVCRILSKVSYYPDKQTST